MTPLPEGVTVHLEPRWPAVLEQDVHPGVGCVTLCQNGVQVGQPDTEGKRSVAQWTQLVKRFTKPMHADVWTLHVEGPLAQLVYAYTPDGRWTIIEHSAGFA